MKKLLSILLVGALSLAFAPDEPVITQKDGLVLGTPPWRKALEKYGNITY